MIANGHEYCTALLKTACFFSRLTPSSEHSSPIDSTYLHSFTAPTSSQAQPTHSTPTSQPTHTTSQRSTNPDATHDSTTKNEDGKSNRPPRSQGIAITGQQFPRRRSSVKHGSMASSGIGSSNPYGTSERKFGSFMRSAVAFNSSFGSSANSWSIWDTDSIDGSCHVPSGSSFRSWFWVNKPDGSDQSGEFEFFS